MEIYKKINLKDKLGVLEYLNRNTYILDILKIINIIKAYIITNYIKIT